MVCHTERYEAGKMALRQQMSTGRLHPLHIVARFHILRRGRVHPSTEREGWIDNVFWHHGCHTVDAILDLLGDAETVDLSAQFGPPWLGLDVPIDVDLQWRSPSGVLVSVSLTHNARWAVHDYRLICEEDTVVCDQGMLLNGEGVLLEAEQDPGPRLRQDREFIAAVREGRAPEVSVQSVLPTIRALQTAWDMRQA